MLKKSVYTYYCCLQRYINGTPITKFEMYRTRVMSLKTSDCISESSWFEHQL
jgi:hypothetical protein